MNVYDYGIWVVRTVNSYNLWARSYSKPSEFSSRSFSKKALDIQLIKNGVEISGKSLSPLLHERWYRSSFRLLKIRKYNNRKFEWNLWLKDSGERYSRVRSRGDIKYFYYPYSMSDAKRLISKKVFNEKILQFHKAYLSLIKS